MRRVLKSFCQFLGEGALPVCRIGGTAVVRAFSRLRIWTAGSHSSGTFVAIGRTGASACALAGLRRLSRIGAQQTIFERSAIKPADDGAHLLLVWRLDKSESLRLLRFRVANYLDRVSDKVF